MIASQTITRFIVPDWASYLAWRPAFASVMDPRLYTPEWLDGLILSGAARFWSTDDAAIIAEVRTYPTGSCEVHGLVAAGNPATIRDILIPLAEQWGREQGCIGAVIESRPAWAKLLREHGYEVHQIAIRKGL